MWAACTYRDVTPDDEDLWATHGAALARVVASYTPPGADRDDLAQEVALAIVRALPRFRGACSLRSYVLRIAHNVGLRHATRRRRWRFEPEVELVDPTASPEAQAARAQEQERLMVAVRALPLSLRQVLTLALEDLSHREIGQILGISDNAVAIRLHRARRQLETLMEAQ